MIGFEARHDYAEIRSLLLSHTIKECLYHVVHEKTSLS